MLSIVFMLVAAFSLKEVCDMMGLTEFLVELVQPILSPALFPVIAFLLGILAFITGSNWGMSAVVTPILLPMCAALGANPVLTMAAIISGRDLQQPRLLLYRRHHPFRRGLPGRGLCAVTGKGEMCDGTKNLWSRSLTSFAAWAGSLPGG